MRSLRRRATIDAAVVDPNLADGEASSLIEALKRREIPCNLPSPGIGPGFTRALLTLGARDCRGLAIALKLVSRCSSCSEAPPTRGPGAVATPLARLGCSVPAPAPTSSAPRSNRKCLVLDGLAAS